MSNTSRIGDLGEKAFEYECLKRSIELWTPIWSNQDDVDFIARVMNKLVEVQVKSTSTKHADREAYGFRWKACKKFDILACHRAETHDWWIIDDIENLPKVGTFITYNGKWERYRNNWSPLMS